MNKFSADPKKALCAFLLHIYYRCSIQSINSSIEYKRALSTFLNPVL